MALESCTDEMLMERVQQGDRQAFAQLVKRHTSKGYALAHRMLYRKESADDAVQEVFLSVWTKASSWQADRGVKFGTWFHRILVNRCIDMNRRKSEEPLSEEHDLRDPSPDIDTALRRKRAQSALSEALRQLPERQRTSIILCHLQGYSQREAADILQTNPKSVESLLGRARARLKTLLRESSAGDLLAS